MSSIIIKGMEMPTSCCYCKFREPFLDFAYCNLGEMDMEYKDTSIKRHPDCPLIALPEKHGDLIDRNAMVKDLKTVNSDYGIFSREWIDAWTYAQPTIVKAEGSEK